MSLTRSALIVVLLATLVVGGCASSGVGAGPSGETTCSEWLTLDDNLSARERVSEGKENKEQQAILKRMLDEHGMDTGEMNRINAEWSIIQFCAPDDTGTRQNLNRSIEDAIDW